VKSEADGLLLLGFLANRFRYLDRDGWSEAISAGRLWINGRPAGPDDILRTGDRLVFEMDDLPEPPVRTDYRILFRDDHLVAVDKPGNLPCHPGGRYFRHTLWYLLRRREGIQKPRFLHRLDRETSGLVLIARTAEAARVGRESFVSGAVRKVYQVLVEGRFPAGTVHAAGWMARDPDSLVRKRRRFFGEKEGIRPPDGDGDVRYCRTKFRLQARRGPLSLVVAVPETGRLHQIRATLSALGLPVVGDKIYGVDETLFLRFLSNELTAADREALRLPRQALHAAGLNLPHPITRDPLRLRSALPAEMAIPGKFLSR
jgi:23S rRNA pseudouridine955/2504/2580 synthase/23S rRNA pseudouridine1911/1915/1917 synthase